MLDKNYFLSLLDYNSWANNEFFKVIAELPEAEVNKQRQSFMNSIRNSLNHLLVIDKIWLANMKKEKHVFTNLQTILFENMNDLWEKKKITENEIRGYVTTLNEDEMEEIIEFELIGGNKSSLPRFMIITHLITHGGYHRGIIAEMCGKIPLPPIAQDITVWQKSR
ncbi:DinB family protein [Alphaproteobacteria bacterium]|nr:DinB family protein [Alphaproteobacteria bacterium]